MADGTTVPQGAGETTAPQFSIDVTDERSAADLFEQVGLLGEPDSGEQRATPQDSGEEPDAGAEETPPTGEEEGQSEPQEAPAAIEPPKSWSAEERAVFSKLPPEAQQVIASRESERDRLINTRTQEVADQRKAVEAERAAIQSQTAQHMQNLQALAAFAIPTEAQQLLQMSPADWAKLSAENPAEYVRLDGQRRAVEGRLGAIQQEMARVQQAQEQQRQQAIAQAVARQSEILKERVPDFADKEKAAKLTQDIRADLSNRGFSDQEIGSVTDARLVEVALDALRWRQHQTTLAAAKAKTAAPQTPRVQKPGVAQDPGEAASRTVQNVIGQFRKTGSLKDAGKLLEHIL